MYSKKVERIAKRWKKGEIVKVSNTPLFKVEKEEYPLFPKYRVFNSRFVINSKDHPLEYHQFDIFSKLSNRLYNSTTVIQKDYFLKNNKSMCYQDLKDLFDNKLYSDVYNRLPKCIRLGTLYYLSEKWFRYGSSLSTTTPLNQPSVRNGKDRKYFFTINPSSVQIESNRSRKSKYKNVIILPKELGTNGDCLYIPTNITSKRSIHEIKVTPYRGLFIVDIKYSVLYNNNVFDYNEYQNRYAGIDIGLENVIALASSVGSRQIKGMEYA